MSERQMLSRCPTAKKVSTAYLPAHKLVFNRRGSYRAGGVASILPSGNPADRVYGVVWAIGDHDIQVLDQIEDPQAYERVTIRVICKNSAEIECYTYIAVPQAEYIAPDREYLNILLTAARAEGLPDEYLKEISRFQTI